MRLRALYLSCWLTVFLFSLLLPFAHGQQRDINTLLDELKIAKHDTTKINIYNQLSSKYINSEPKKAQKYAETSLRMAQENSYDLGQAQALNNLGMVFAMQGKYDTALVNYTKSLRIKEQLKDVRGIASILSNVAIIYERKGSYTASLAHHLKAYRIRDSIGEMAGVAASLTNIANINMAQGQYDQAMENYMRALRISKDAKEEPEELVCLVSIGAAYIQKNELKTAEDYLQRGINLAEKLYDKQAKTQALFYLGKAFTEHKRYPEALKTLQQSLSLAEETGNEAIEADILQQLAEVHLKLGDQEKAAETANKGLIFANRAGAKPTIAKATKLLYNYYKQRKEFEKALMYQELYLENQESLAREEKNKNYAEMEAKHRLVQQEAEMKYHREEYRKLKIERDNYAAKEKLQFFLQIGLGAVLVLMIIAMFFLYRNDLQRRKSNEELTKLSAEFRLQKDKEAQQAKLIADKNSQLEEINNQISKSIEAALTIQRAILPEPQKMEVLLKDYFTIYRPKDVVSGDFYWVGEQDGKTIFAAVDCTGHGVPGAFMSLIGSTLLDRVTRVRGITDAAEILTELNKEVTLILKKHIYKQSDTGMDMGVVVLEKTLKGEYIITFSGAKTPMYFIKKGQTKIEILKGVKRSIGFDPKDTRPFTDQEVYLEKGSIIYLTSDGFADQNNVKQEKMGTQKFIQLLEEHCEKPMQEQKTALENFLIAYQGTAKQRDDIMLMAVKLS